MNGSRCDELGIISHLVYYPVFCMFLCLIFLLCCLCKLLEQPAILVFQWGDTERQALLQIVDRSGCTFILTLDCLG